MDYEKFYQAVVLAYINHDGDSVRFFDEVVAALNQFREEKQAAQQIGEINMDEKLKEAIDLLTLMRWTANTKELCDRVEKFIWKQRKAERNCK